MWANHNVGIKRILEFIQHNAGLTHSPPQVIKTERQDKTDNEKRRGILVNTYLKLTYITYLEILPNVKKERDEWERHVALLLSLNS